MPSTWASVELKNDGRSTLTLVSCIDSVPATPNSMAMADGAVEARPQNSPSIRKVGAQISASMPKSCTSGSSTST